MSATYTHYRFGVQMLKNMPADLARTAHRYRQLYDMGLHGPDIFFYCPWMKEGGRKVASGFHQYTGTEFFQRACRLIRLKKCEPAVAYLYGVLCHYALDSVFHPYIVPNSANSAAHLTMENEFDRHLLELDGKIPAHSVDLSKHIRLNAKECQIVSLFYPGITPSQISSSVRNMHIMVKLLALPDGLRRTALEKSVSAAGETPASIFMPKQPHPEYNRLIPMFMDFYQKAADNYQQLLLQLDAHLTYNAPLGEEFNLKFG